MMDNIIKTWKRILLMYGIIKTSIHNSQDIFNYKRIQCSLCNHIGWRYGNPTRLLVNTDSIFLGLLLDAQMKHVVGTAIPGCKLLQKNRQPDILLDYVSSVSILLCEARAIDAYYDGDSRTHILYKLLQKRVKKAEKALRELGFDPTLFKQLLRKQCRIEKRGNASIEELCEPSAKLVSAILSHTAQISGIDLNREPLAEIGYDLGSLIYILDSVVDFEEDRALNKFNPISLCEPGLTQVKKIGDIPTTLINICQKKLVNIDKNCEKLKLIHNRSQIVNTFTKQLPARVDQILTSPTQTSINSPKISMNILLPASLIALRAVVSQDSSQDIEACCSLCSCEAFAEEASEAIFEEMVNRGVAGGGAALVGGGAGIIGARLLRNRKLKRKTPRESTTPREEPIPATVKPTTLDTTPQEPVTPPGAVPPESLDMGQREQPQTGHAVNIRDQPLSGTQLEPPFPVLETPPPEYPSDGVMIAYSRNELLDDLIEICDDSLCEHVLNFFREEQQKVPIPENLPDHMKIDEEKSWWDYLHWGETKTSEEIQAELEGLAEAGEVLDESSPFGSGGGITRAIGGGVNAQFIDQVHDEMVSEAGKKGLKWFRAGVHFTQGSLRTGGGPSATRHSLPGTRSPLGPGRALRDAAAEIGKDPAIVRSLEGIPSAVLDARVYPDAADFIEWMKIQKKDSIGHQTYIKFMEIHKKIPDTSDPSDIEAFKEMYDDIKMEAEQDAE